MTRRKTTEVEASEATSTNTTILPTNSAPPNDAPLLEQGASLSSEGQQDEERVSQERQPIEALEGASREPSYILAAARAAERWLPGQEITQADFDAAVSRVKGQEVI